MTKNHRQALAGAAAVLAAAGLATTGPGAAQATEDEQGWQINRGAIVFSAQYLGRMDGTMGNVHDVAIESEGDMNYVQSWYCPAGADRLSKDGCTLRGDRRISPRSPLDLRVSSTGRSATVRGTARTVPFGGGTARSFAIDLTLRAAGPLEGGRRDLTSVYGSVGGNGHDVGASGFLRP